MSLFHKIITVRYVKNIINLELKKTILLLALKLSFFLKK